MFSGTHGPITKDVTFTAVELQKERGNRAGLKNYVKKLALNLPKFVKNHSLQIHEAEQNLNRINPKKPMP